MKKMNLVSLSLVMMVSCGLLTGCAECAETVGLDKFAAEVSDFGDQVEDTLGVDISIPELSMDHKGFYLENVPDPEMLYPNSNIDNWSDPGNNGELYGFTVSGMTKDDFDSYIDAVNNDVFVHVFSNTDTFYHAASSSDYENGDYYSLEVRFREDSEELVVTCGYVGEKSTSEY